jgi:phage N-6-adenine-methyltransferase
MAKPPNSTTDVAFPKAKAIANALDAAQALKTIAVAEAAEKLWARAKDPTKLYAAIEAKLTHQAAYAVGRQDVVVPSQKLGIGRGVKRMAVLPSASKPVGDPGATVIKRWRKRLCRKVQANRWATDKAKLDAALTDARERCRRICEQENISTIRGTEGTGEFERYTPKLYIDKAREVLGEIDLDPATSKYAQKTVGATEYFTADDDGLERDWKGRVWLNPPYHRELAPKFINKLVAELVAGRVTEAIMLTNNSTDTEWFRTAADACDRICFTTGRIHFEVPDAESVLPTQGQAFFYFGTKTKEFVKVFKSVGWCVRPI